MVDSNAKEEAVPGQTLKSFLETTPPEVSTRISDLLEQGSDRHYYFACPDLELFCPTVPCGGMRFFHRSSGRVYISSIDAWRDEFVVYVCRNCGRTRKTYALTILWNGNGLAGLAYKYGEVPSFGPSIPPKLISLIGPDKDLFMQGLRAENRGLGIGAFAYYRRVVENQWARIVGDVIKVVQRIDGDKGLLSDLNRIATETQFKKAVEDFRPAIPQILLIDGCHNPLTLLHGTLSEGLHGHSDEECLTRAKAIRTVLSDLAERIAQALRSEAQLTEAVGQLQARRDRKVLTTDPGTAAQS